MTLISATPTLHQINLNRLSHGHIVTDLPPYVQFWEYRKFTGTEDEFNDLGRKGWDLVAVRFDSPSGLDTGYFKRDLAAATAYAIIDDRKKRDRMRKP